MRATNSQASTEPVRILAVANETVEGEELCNLIQAHADGRRAEVMVIAPALNSRVRHWFSDHDRARQAAEDRLYRTLQRLDEAGLTSYGWVGDADPLEAIADAIAVFDADQMIIATHPEHRSNWMARNVVGRARERFGLPTAHVVVHGHAAEVLAAA